MGDRLSDLKLLYMGQNWMEGRIPNSLGNASMLQSVVLQTNNFTGRIPSSFGKLSSLSILDLELNMLEAKDSESWEFLHALENCSALRVLALSNNQLQGVIPNSVGNLSSSLQYLLLGGNKLSGTVPPNIGKLSGLVLLTLDECSLTGSIDGWL
jgi:Leucine-rich repeat (LRR) protein